MYKTFMKRFGTDKGNELLSWYYEHGYVYSGDDAFVLACKVNENFVEEEDNAWFIQYIVGDMTRIFDLCNDDSMEWIIFERENNPDIKLKYKFKRMRGFIMGKGDLPDVPKAVAPVQETGSMAAKKAEKDRIKERRGSSSAWITKGQNLGGGTGV